MYLPSGKWSHECSQMSWAYSQNVVRTNEIERLLLGIINITYHFSCSSNFSLSAWISEHILSGCSAKCSECFFLVFEHETNFVVSRDENRKIATFLLPSITFQHIRG